MKKLRKCKLPGCDKYFTPVNASHAYCGKYEIKHSCAHKARKMHQSDHAKRRQQSYVQDDSWLNQ